MLSDKPQNMKGQLKVLVGINPTNGKNMLHLHRSPRIQLSTPFIVCTLNCDIIKNWMTFL